MVIRKVKILPAYLVGFIITLIISIVIGLRDKTIGTDTVSYVWHFYEAVGGIGIYNRFEPGFDLLMEFVGFIGGGVEFFLFLVAFIITIFYFLLSLKVIRELDERGVVLPYVFLSFALILFSSWYVTATTNGLRQGLSLVFVYYSLYYVFFQKSFIKFSAFYIIAISFHYSSLVVLPFLVISFFSYRFTWLIWALSAIFYVFGINEILIQFSSAFTGLGAYEMIKFYTVGEDGVGSGLYEGFHWSFFLYTIFWPLFVLLFYKSKIFFKANQINKKTIEKLIQIYLILSIPYFVFGFGPFSNRFAFIAWLFVPILQLVVLFYIRLKYRLLFFILVFLTALLYFFVFRMNWLGLAI